MFRCFRPLSPVSAAALVALVACGETPTPTGPEESPSLTVATAVSYSAHDLGLGGEFSSTARSINTAGQVVGYTFDPDNTFRGFIWHNGVITHLGSLGGGDTRAFDINDVGQVVGSSKNAFGGMRAFRWVNGIMRNLGTLGGSVSGASAINNLGHIVGQSQLTGNVRDPKGNPVVHAFLWKKGVMTDLGTLGGSSSAALDINDAGQVVGWSQTSDGTRHPFLWQNGVMKDLFPSGSISTGTANAIDPSGVVVGERNNRAFRWIDGVVSGLGMGGLGPSVANGIRKGRIVGTVGGRAFVRVSGELTLLPLIPSGGSGSAYAVNGAGVIVGFTAQFFDESCGEECGSSDRVIRWTPE